MAAAKALIRIATTRFDPLAEARAFAESHRASGAIVTFTGQVRPEGGAIDALSLEHYPGFTEAQIAGILKQVENRWRLDGLLVIHRVGSMRPEEAIVFVAAASKHRRDAFLAVDFVMDYLKSAAPFWKKEISGGNENWIAPRSEDHTDLERWTAKDPSNARH